MSRVAKNPVTLPKGVTAATDGATVTVKGAKGTLALPLRRGLSLVQEGQTVRVEIAERNRESLMHAGSLRAHLANIVHGVSQGYEKKLELVGVGYRAQAQGRSLEPDARLLAPGRLRGARGHHGRDADADRDPDQGRRQAAGRPGRRGDPRVPCPGALQGQGRSLLR